MYRLGKYTERDNMSELISENYRVLSVLSRFGIALGVGDKTIGEVCGESNVDAKTFLTVVNMLLDEDGSLDKDSYEFSLKSLMTYLHNAHEYFLGYRLPSIRTELEAALEDKNSNLARAILNYFDEYVAEVQSHMMYEENTVFPYVRALTGDGRPVDYSIDIFRERHDKVESRLSEFKNILIKYYSAKNTNEINNVLFDIFNCEHDLASHNEIEDRLFVPAIAELENKKRKK